ncbi:MAG: hypothetical protein CMI18_02115 [Opitutaceae bacterium]|nr:hypothetical protein [Opitutaceae bacterium]
MKLLILPLTVVLILLAGCSGNSRSESEIIWTVKRLAQDANEGIAIADFNGDGLPDIAAGRNWYPAPEYIPHPVRSFDDWNGYVESNGDFAYDVNKDGLMDIVSGSFLPTEVYWFENPGPDKLTLGHMFIKHYLTDTGYSRNEATMMHDIDGDGSPEWITNSYDVNNAMAVWSFSSEEREVKVRKGNQVVTEKKWMPTLKTHLIGESGNGHGMAFGDINGDGREDIMVGMGWYERPEGDPMSQLWIWHPHGGDNWHASVPSLVRDLNGDGINDVVWGKGHDFGLFWWEGLGIDDKGQPQWKEHLIDDSFSQPHALHWADIDGDGVDELITGKRFFAHNGGDPGGLELPEVYYYEWNKGTNTFERHTINDSGEVGIGLQIRTHDLDGDGDLDIALAGKSGTHLLFNQRR